MISKSNFSYLKFKEDFAKDPIKTLENDPDCKFGNSILPFKGLLALVVLHSQKKIEPKEAIQFLNYIAATIVDQLDSFHKFFGVVFSQNQQPLKQTILELMVPKY